MDPTPGHRLFASKRARMTLLGLVLVLVAASDYSGIPADMRREALYIVAGLVGTFIAGQSTTDWVTKGRTSASHSDRPHQVQLQADPALKKLGGLAEMLAATGMRPPGSPPAEPPKEDAGDA